MTHSRKRLQNERIKTIGPKSGRIWFKIKIWKGSMLTVFVRWGMKSSGSAQTCCHWYSPCMAHHRQPIVTAYSAGSRVWLRQRKNPESQDGKKVKVNLLKVTANITNVKSTCKAFFSHVEGGGKNNKWLWMQNNGIQDESHWDQWILLVF